MKSETLESLYTTISDLEAQFTGNTYHVGSFVLLYLTGFCENVKVLLQETYEGQNKPEEPAAKRIV